jgi:hypothetical protein
MKRSGSFGVLDEGVIALPSPVRLLMKLHFDLDAFVDGLNRSRLLRFAPGESPCGGLGFIAWWAYSP